MRSQGDRRTTATITSVAILITLLLVALLAVSTDTGAQESLPPEARTAFDRGLAAAQQQEWSLAIQHFEAARIAVPTWPQALFNLALASDKAGGRDLLAIIWYRAYLAATPGAANVGLVQARIPELETRVRTTARQLLRSAEETLNKLGLPPGVHRGVLASRAEAYAHLGEVVIAKGIADQILDKEFRTGVYKSIVYIFAEAGMLEAAENLVSLVPDDSDRVRGEKSAAYYYIARAQVEAKDLNRAKATASSITDPTWQTTAYLRIYEAQMKGGDNLGAHESLDRARKSASRSGDTLGIVQSQVENGDLRGARETAVQIPDPIIRAQAFVLMGSTHMRAGNLREARDTLNLAKVTLASVAGDQEPRANRLLLHILTLLGETAAAKELADRIPNAREALEAFVEIAEAQIMLGDLAGAESTLSRVPITGDWLSQRLRAQIRLAEAQARTGHVGRAINTAAQINQIKNRGAWFSALESIAMAQKDFAAGEIYRWASRVDQDFLNPKFQDLPGFLYTLKSKNPEDAYGALSYTALDILVNLAHIRREMTRWKKYTAELAEQRK